MTSVSITGVIPVQLQQTSASGWSLQNVGPGVLYLGNDASVSPSSGYSVPPGVSLPLAAGAAIWGCTTAGETVQLQLLQGATASQATIVEANVPGAIDTHITNSSLAVTATIENASIPVTGTVDANITNGTIDVNGAVNATITNATLHTDTNITNATLDVAGNVNATITNASIPVSGSVAISSGTVDISAGSVAVTGVAGNVSTVAGAVPTSLAHTVPTFAAAAHAFSYIYPATTIDPTKAINVAKYQSVVIGITGGFAAGGPATINPGSYITVDIMSFDGANVPIGPIHAEFLLDTAMNHILRVPVVGPTMLITIGYAKVATSVGGTIGITYYGSSQPITDIQYVSDSSLLLGNSNIYSFLANANNTDYVVSTNGPASFNMYGNSSVVNGVVYALQGGVALGIAALFITSSVPAIGTNIQLPLLPIKVVAGYTSGSVAMSLVQ